MGGLGTTTARSNRLGAALARAVRANAVPANAEPANAVPVKARLAAVMVMAALATFGFAPSASAQDDPPSGDEELADVRARELYQLGDSLYAHGQYDAAIGAFREAYRLSGRPLLLFNLANAQERAGYLEDAVASLEAYEEDAPESERPSLANRIEALRERIAARPVETAPEPEPEPEPERPSETLVMASPQAMPVRDAAPREPSVAPAVVFLTAAGALSIAGLAFGLVTLDARDTANALCVRDGPRRVCQMGAEDALSRSSTFGLLTDISFVGALVTAGLGLYLLLDALLGSGDSEADLTLDAAVGPGLAAFTLRGPF